MTAKTNWESARQFILFLLILAFVVSEYVNFFSMGDIRIFAIAYVVVQLVIYYKKFKP